ncbi:hypothetical protein NNC19_05305 [Clostridium sp. SHJSY1]|uniref:hypothetical protein n=1 Tax=Clostridium sp. SHJSY1 TaxID=2942483 RepID=UPI002875A7B3|nr:hypothetical protein [Clostridium sp. SHJSY1]MDS0525091.1 hypothetical protein [Clostridium sp. SHJSY1]
MEVIKLGLYLTIGMIGVFIILGFFIGWLNKKSINYIYTAFGKTGLYITSFIGTPIHEFGHYVMCKLFMHKVVEVKWFIPSAVGRGGTLGYVKHSRHNNLYQRVGDFFIGIGPLFIGSIIIVVLSKFLIPNTFNTIFNMINIHEFNFRDVLKSIFSIENISNYKFWIFIILAISISSHMSLSKPDIENSYFGAITLLFINMTIAFAFVNLKIDTNLIIKFIYAYNFIFIALLSIGVISILSTIVLSKLWIGVKRIA